VARDGGEVLHTCEDANAMVGDRRNLHDVQGRRCHCGNHSDTGNGEGNAAVGGEDDGDGRVRGGVVRTCEDYEMRRGEGPAAVRWARTGGPVAWRRRRCVAGVEP
jgi:hypothetical protein